MATDRISNLSDDVLGKILSLVPTKLAASTTVLSKRWRNLLPLALVDSLDFDESMLTYPERRKDGEEEATSRESGLRRRHGFSHFVDKTLALLSNSARIKKFSLKCCYEDDESCGNRWIRTALERGCWELYIESRTRLRIDSEFFTSNTLVKLTMSDDVFPVGGLPSGGVFFPALKTLRLVSVAFSSCKMIKHFIRGCPALEELFMYEWMSYLSTPYLKRLTITSDFDDRFEIPSIKLKTRGLLYLDYSGYVAGDYYVYLDSLVEARLDLRLYEPDVNEADGPLENEIYGDVTRLIEGMKNVKSLHLSPDSLDVFYFCCDSMPVLNNLLTLSIESDEGRGWQAIPRLLNSSPKLQTLIIKGLVHRFTDWCGDACACIRMEYRERVCCLSRCGVKVLEISGYGGSLGELRQMRHFLGKLKRLETVKISVAEDINNIQSLLRANLMALPRASSKCNIQFI